MKCQHKLSDVEKDYVDHHMYQAWCRNCGAQSKVFKNDSELQEDGIWTLPKREQER